MKVNTGALLDIGHDENVYIVFRLLPSTDLICKPKSYSKRFYIEQQLFQGSVLFCILLTDFIFGMDRFNGHDLTDYIYNIKYISFIYLLFLSMLTTRNNYVLLFDNTEIQTATNSNFTSPVLCLYLLSFFC